jgi:branched-chain amino acid transport system permease protein
MLENLALIWKGPAPLPYPDLFPSVDILREWFGLDSLIFLTTMGINVEKTILLTFFIGGALAGAAGLIQGIYYNIGMWYMGYQAGLRAFTAAVLGGIGNMPGAALGGFLIGFLSAWSDQYISARWTNAIVFSILILVLVFRPHGLLGERTPEKV